MLRPAPDDTIFNLWYAMCFTYVVAAILTFILLTFFLKRTLWAEDKEREAQVKAAGEAFRENFNKTRGTSIDIYSKAEAKYLEYMIQQYNPELPNRNVFGSVLGKLRSEWRKTAGNPKYYLSKIFIFSLLSLVSIIISYFIAGILVGFVYYMWDFVFNVYIAGQIPLLTFYIFFFIWFFFYCKGDKRDGIFTLEDMEYYDCGPDDKFKADIYITFEESDHEEQDLEISEGFFRWNDSTYYKPCNRYIENPNSHMFDVQQLYMEVALYEEEKRVAVATGRTKRRYKYYFPHVLPTDDYVEGLDQ